MITHEHQINLLIDILTSHLNDCCGSLSEYEQLTRLVDSLTNNVQVSDPIKTLLKEIYYYSEAGLQTTHIDQHIQTYEHQLSNWITTMGVKN